MNAGMIGLGKMGMNMAKRLLRRGHSVAAFNRSPEKVEEIVREGARGAASPGSFRELLEPPRVIWVMLPAGAPTDDMIENLRTLLDPGDIVVNGGNCLFRDDFRYAEALRKKSIHYLDAGVSGGIWGLTEGYCLMIGGAREIFLMCEPLFEALAPENGYLYCGRTGSGHFVKMVHNGIEYAIMAAYGEGFAMLRQSEFSGDFNSGDIARLWNRGSVIRSWLLELIGSALEKDPDLSSVKGYVEDSGEGRWTVQYAVEQGIPLPVISLSLFQRFRSREHEAFSDRLLAALRQEFGGHAVAQKGSEDS